MKKLFALLLLFALGVLISYSYIKLNKKEATHEIHILEHKTFQLEEVLIAPEYNREELIGRTIDATTNHFVEEKTPFDEPRIENGQEDGALRPLWIQAWRRNEGRYYHNGATYYAWDQDHNPLPPQVCIDFIVDTFDRAGGNWWYKVGKKGVRVDHENSLTGAIKKYNEGLPEDSLEKIDPGRIGDVIKYFDLRPDLFEKVVREEDSGPKIGNVKKIEEYFREYKVERGDIVFINGRAPWDAGRAMHFHSFFMKSYSEEEGWKIVGNSVMVAERSLKVELRRTPRRKIWAIYRPTNLLLYKIVNNNEL